jgi:holo-[acyl-carrier protein] synthase
MRSGAPCQRIRGGKVIIGVGVDIVEIERLRGTLERQHDRFIRRVFTDAEQDYCRMHRDPVPHYAARFAAKEALFKALGTGWAKGLSWKDAEVVRTPMGAPVLKLLGQAQNLSLSLGTRAAHLSLSHSRDFAVAIVILEQ